MLTSLPASWVSVVLRDWCMPTFKKWLSEIIYTSPSLAFDKQSIGVFVVTRLRYCYNREVRRLLQALVRCKGSLYAAPA
eukprot:34797-Eustigmatos_ZCMA.PRE.1